MDGDHWYTLLASRYACIIKCIVFNIDSRPANEVDDSSDLSFSDLTDILFRRRKIIYILVLIGFVAGAVSMLRARKYTAVGELRIEPDSASMYRMSPASLLSGEKTDKIASQVGLVQSRGLYLQVAKELNLVNDPTFWGSSHVKELSLDDAVTREKLVRRMKKMIGVKHDSKDELVDIFCTSESPALSAKIVNTLINDYISNLFRMRFGSTKRVSEWLIGQLDDLKQQVVSDQGEIISLQKKLGVIGVNPDKAEYLQAESLNSISKASSEATVERILAEVKLRSLEQSDPNLVEGEISILSQGQADRSPNSLLQNLRNAQAQAASNYSSLLAQFGADYPEVRQQKAQLEEITKGVRTEQTRILNQAKLSYSATVANESMQNSLLHQKTAEAFNSGGDMVKYVLLLHDYESHRGLYEALVQRLREAGITSGLEAGGIDVVDLADLPAIPNPPGPLLLLLGSLLVGLIAGVVIAFLVDLLDTRITNFEQAERATGLPLLAMLPSFDAGIAKGKGQAASSVSFAPPKSQYSSAIQSLRTSVLLVRPGTSPKKILVTSALPGEGKSTTARNLAMGFARYGQRVLLIDCDLHRGTQAIRLKLSTLKGVSDVLTRQVKLEDVVQVVPGSEERLFLLTGGSKPPDPAVLLGSPQMAKLVEECASKYDILILDSAPVLGLADAVNLGNLIDAVMLVVRERFSNRRAIRDAISTIKMGRLPLIGFVLNDIDDRAHRYGYGYSNAYNEYFTGESA